MPKYKLNIDTPDTIKSLLEVLNGAGEVTSLDDQNITFVFETEKDDDYELAILVKGWEEELNSIVGWREITLNRPEEISDDE